MEKVRGKGETEDKASFLFVTLLFNKKFRDSGGNRGTHVRMPSAATLLVLGWG